MKRKLRVEEETDWN